MRKLGNELFNRKRNSNSYSIEDGIIFRGHCDVPSKFRKTVLEKLHKGHIGIVKMKLLARSYVYWSNITSDIEKFIRSCKECQINAHDPRKADVHPWKPAGSSWSRIHVDYAESFFGKTYLIVMDSFLKWPEVFFTSTMTTAETICGSYMLYIQ